MAPAGDGDAVLPVGGAWALPVAKGPKVWRGRGGQCALKASKTSSARSLSTCSSHSAGHVRLSSGSLGSGGDLRLIVPARAAPAPPPRDMEAAEAVTLPGQTYASSLASPTWSEQSAELLCALSLSPEGGWCDGERGPIRAWTLAEADASDHEAEALPTRIASAPSASEVGRKARGCQRRPSAASAARSAVAATRRALAERPWLHGAARSPAREAAAASAPEPGASPSAAGARPEGGGAEPPAEPPGGRRPRSSGAGAGAAERRRCEGPARPAGLAGDCAGLAQQGPEAPDDVDRLVARCMTHERPVALVQASPQLLDACAARLGETASASEKRSDKIRRVLRLTDELRRYNAGLTEASMG